MATVRKTVTLTDKQDDRIKARIAAGNDTNDSEYIRDPIHREQERTAEVDAIRHALIEGEISGEPRPFDAANFKQALSVVSAG